MDINFSSIRNDFLWKEKDQRKMLFEQIKASPLQQQWKDEFDAQLWARPRHSWTVLFILTVLHTVVVISAFIWCQCLAIDIKFMHIQSVSVSKCHLPGATFKLKDVFFTTEFILNLLVVKCVRSAILVHSAIEMIIIIFPVSAGHKMSVLFFYCIPQLFSYNYPGYAVIYVHFIFVLLSPITLSFVWRLNQAIL